MVVEQFPELERLDGEQKLILAGELWKSVTSPNGEHAELPSDIAAMLEERLAHLEANPETGVKWEDLRDQLLED